MVEFLQAHFVVLMCAIVVSTAVWAVVSSLVPRRKQKVEVSVKLQGQQGLRARRTIAARG